jgi:hypothetical protein
VFGAGCDSTLLARCFTGPGCISIFVQGQKHRPRIPTGFRLKAQGWSHLRAVAWLPNPNGIVSFSPRLPRFVGATLGPPGRGNNANGVVAGVLGAWEGNGHNRVAVGDVWKRCPQGGSYLASHLPFYFVDSSQKSLYVFYKP